MLHKKVQMSGVMTNYSWPRVLFIMGKIIFTKFALEWKRTDFVVASWNFFTFLPTLLFLSIYDIFHTQPSGTDRCGLGFGFKKINHFVGVSRKKVFAAVWQFMSFLSHCFLCLIWFRKNIIQKVWICSKE